MQSLTNVGQDIEDEQGSEVLLLSQDFVQSENTVPTVQGVANADLQPQQSSQLPEPHQGPNEAPLELEAPVKKQVKKKVLIRDLSLKYSEAGESSAYSGGTSAFGGTVTGAVLSSGLGLAVLNREEWSEKELEQREFVVPLLRTTLGQIDGSIKPKLSSLTHSKTTAQNMEDFGHLFYQEVFEKAPQLQQDLFASKTPDSLALKLSSILSELVRLLELETPLLLSSAISELALRHIEYGLMREHVKPFKEIMLDCLKKAVTSKGHKWSRKFKKAWDWALTEVSGLIMEAVESGRPKIETLKRSWRFLCERMAEEAAMGSKAGFRRTVMKSQMRTSVHSSRLSRGSATSEAEQQSDLVEQSHDGPVAGLRQRLAVAYRAGGARMAMRTLWDFSWGSGGGGKDGQASGEIPLWMKKESNADPEYLAGRLAVGAGFLKLYAQRNPWAVEQFSFGLRPQHAEKMGLALELIVNSATRPQVLQHQLRVLALGHVQMGIKPEMFKSFEEALFAFLGQVLGAHNTFDEETEGAWRWMWGIVNAVFTQHMEASSKIITLIEKSWAFVESRCDLMEVSNKFFERLFQRAPALQNMFTKPKRVQYVMLAKALDLIVRSAGETKVMNEDIKAIALRHIKYDIRQEHLNVFGSVLVETLANSVGPENWDEDISAAWASIYGNIAAVFGHIISNGRNLVSKALASGKTEDLRRALEAAPRRQRVLAALEIDVDDSVISPLVWAIQEGQLHLAELLLSDMLAIRSDRESYYWGRSLLWSKHPWITQLLVEKAPRLLPTFLDGHLWTSAAMKDGARRVNFYVKELYGDPSVLRNGSVNSTPLGLIVFGLPASEVHVFAHPVIKFLVDLKWDQFARTDFLKRQAVNAAILIFGTSYLYIGADNPKASLVLAVLQLVAAVMRFTSIVRENTRACLTCIASQASQLSLRGLSFQLPSFMRDAFLIINFVSSSMVIVLFAHTWIIDPFEWGTAFADAPAEVEEAETGSLDLEIWSMLAAFTSALLWLQSIEAFKVTMRLSALLFSMTAVVSDVARFVLVLTVWATGISITLYWLMVGDNLGDGMHIGSALDVDLPPSEDTDIGTLIYYVLMSCLGITGIEAIMRSNWYVRIVYAMCVLTTVVVILNLLVSTMVSTYETLNRSFHELAVKTRARLVLRAEESLTAARRKRLFESCGFDAKLDFEDGDEGPSGGIQCDMPVSETNHPAFCVHDRVERYAGTSSPDAPWDPSDKLVNAAALNHRPGKEKDRANHELLLRIDEGLSRLGTELFTLRRGLGVDDDASSVSRSVAGDGYEARKDPQPAEDLLAPPPTALEPIVEENGAEEGAVASGTAELREVSLQELQQHSTPASLWLCVNGEVRDVTTLLGFHPGGREVLLREAGPDATLAFAQAHTGPSLTIANATWNAMPLVGRLVSAEGDATHLPGVVNQEEPTPQTRVPRLQGLHSLERGTALESARAATLPTHTPRDVELDI